MCVGKIDKITFGETKKLNFYLHCCKCSNASYEHNIFTIKYLWQVVNVWEKKMPLVGLDEN